jgi:hypothetical protein
MSLQSDAEENLRVIRSLMEKATIYRAISAPGALIGGLVSIVLLAIALARSGGGGGLPFLPAWIGALGLTSLANFWLLRRDAARRGEDFVSPGMRLALRAMAPALLAGGVCTVTQADSGPTAIASLWVLLYGVSLLAASHFAPRSIRWLGRAFFLAGTALVAGSALVFDWWRGADQTTVAHIIMGGSFGAFHLIYAAFTWPRGAAAAGGAS